MLSKASTVRLREVHNGRPFLFSSKGGMSRDFSEKKRTFRDLFFEPKIQTFPVKVFKLYMLQEMRFMQNVLEYHAISKECKSSYT